MLLILFMVPVTLFFSLLKQLPRLAPIMVQNKSSSLSLKTSYYDVLLTLAFKSGHHAKVKKQQHIPKRACAAVGAGDLLLPLRGQRYRLMGSVCCE